MKWLRAFYSVGCVVMLACLTVSVAEGDTFWIIYTGTLAAIFLFMSGNR